MAQDAVLTVLSIMIFVLIGGIILMLHFSPDKNRMRKTDDKILGEKDYADKVNKELRKKYHKKF
jgi:hypothetical protein